LPAIDLDGIPAPVSGADHAHPSSSSSATMTTILVMSETLPLAHVKAKFSEMVDRVEHTHDRIVFTRNGRPTAVMISPDGPRVAGRHARVALRPDRDERTRGGAPNHADGDYVTGDELRARFPTT
jgi:prevent-host-death family protein